HRDDRFIVMNQLLALLSFDAQAARVFEVATSLQHLHAAHFSQLSNSPGEPCENGFLPRPQLGNIDGRGAKTDAAMFGFANRGDGMGGMEKRFGRDAPAIEADTAQAWVALDQQHLFAKVRSIKGCGITAGAGANYYDFSLNGIHGREN